jgi:hypothetical protein
MPRGRRKAKEKKEFSIFDDEATGKGHEDEDLPKDEAGRLRIKRRYEELLGLRLEKLRGRILNRERINKTIDGIYFICAECRKVCHNLDEGLAEDPNNQSNLCGRCAKQKGSSGGQAAA